MAVARKGGVAALPSPSRRAGALCAPVCLLLPSCIEWSVRGQDDQVIDPITVEEQFVQDDLARMDILWVIANDGSMAEEQDALADALSVFADALDTTDLAWQLGVVKTDVSGDDAGLLQGDPWVITPAVDDPVDALLTAADVGTDGAAPESGLGAAWLALSEPLRSGDNRGFRRDDAGLHVIFVSDGDDASTALLGADPAAAFLDFLGTEAERTDHAVLASAVVGEPPTGCTGDGGIALGAQAYTQVVEATGGTLGSICTTDFAPLVEAIADASQDWTTRFPLQAAPVADSLRVAVDGERLDAGWTLDEQEPAVVFDEAPAPGAQISVRYEVLEQ